MQFGVNVRSIDSPAAFAAHVRRADELGYDVLAVPDHIGAPDPFVVLATAAQLSARLRLRTYVLNAGFHNAALLARAVATLDALSRGRVELGLGTGYAKDEFAAARLPFLPYPERLAAMEALAIGVREHLATPVPLVIGAMSRRGLAVAARHADIVAFAGLRITPAGFAMSGPEETDAAIAQVRNAAAGRPYRTDVLLQAVTVEGDPRAQAAAWAPEMDVDALLASPYALFAPDPASARAELEHRRTRWGFDCFMTHAPHLEALGAVIAAG